MHPVLFGGPRSRRSSGDPGEAGNGLRLLSCDKGELRVYYQCSCRRERGAAGAVCRGQGSLQGAGGAGRPGQCRPLLSLSAALRLHPGKVSTVPRFSAQRTLDHGPGGLPSLSQVASVSVGEGHRERSCATSARPRGSPRLAQEHFGAYRGEQRDAQEMRGDSIPREMSPCASNKVFAPAGSATHRVQLP